MPYKEPNSDAAHESARKAAERWREQHPDEARESNRANASRRRAADPTADQAYMVAWRAKNAAKMREYRERRKAMNCPEFYRKQHLKRYYNLTPDAYEALVNAQGGVCAICQKTPSGKGRASKLHVDHDHSTQKNRGLLCHHCNTALQLVESDPEWGTKALNYLSRYIEQVARR